MKNAIFTEDSKNEKISGKYKIACTYVPIENSCSDKCQLKKHKICYAKQSFVGMINHRLEQASKALTPIDIAKAEAKAIINSFKGKPIPQDGKFGGRDLRLHVSGDSRTKAGTKILSFAAQNYINRGGGKVYTYTHSWHNQPRKQWGKISVLASLDNYKDAPKARALGYAPAIVVETFPSDKAFSLPESDVKWIPCPAQTKDVSCVDCRLCFDADKLFERNVGISFASHGSGKKNIRKLNVVK